MTFVRLDDISARVVSSPLSHGSYHHHRATISNGIKNHSIMKVYVLTALHFFFNSLPCELFRSLSRRLTDSFRTSPRMRVYIDF